MSANENVFNALAEESRVESQYDLVRLRSLADDYDEQQAADAAFAHDEWCRTHPITRRLQHARWMAGHVVRALRARIGMPVDREAVPF